MITTSRLSAQGGIIGTTGSFSDMTITGSHIVIQTPVPSGPTSGSAGTTGQIEWANIDGSNCTLYLYNGDNWFFTNLSVVI